MIAPAQTPALRMQAVTWFCKSAERVDELMHAPGIAFMHKMMRSIAKGDCGVGLHGTSFMFMPEAVVAKGESSESEKYVVLKGKLFPRSEAIEVYAPFDEDSLNKKPNKEKAKPTAGQPV